MGLVQWRRDGWGKARTGAAGRALVVSAAWVLTVCGLVAVSRYQNAVYLLPALPLLAIGAGLSASAILARVDLRRRAVAAMTVVLLLAHVVASHSAVSAITNARTDEARVVRALTESARAGGVCFGGSATALAVVPRGVDVENIYSAAFGSSSFVRDDRRYDRLTGRLIVGSVRAVQPIFERSQRSWYRVSEKDRRTGRVSDELHGWLCARMVIVAEGGGLTLRCSAP